MEWSSATQQLCHSSGGKPMIIDVPDYTEILADYHQGTEFTSRPPVAGSEQYTDIIFHTNPQ